ncbi:transketolase-like TK C-terminal-containing protein [Streptomyces tsukubensis]|uniref:transketolase-like TK C-terminal-containing protein n=1 Tax=Streptomyces tsukubensis TaxID=83656 RepID=UPI00344DDEBB
MSTTPATPASPPPASAPTAAELATVAQGLRAFAFAANKHPGGSSSSIEALTALYFSGTTRLADPDGGDRLVYSKGHAAAGWFGALWALGAMPGTGWEEAAGFGQVGHPVPRMPVRGTVPGMEMSTGALGQGLSFGAGLALADRRTGRAGRTFVLLGDGECTEGQVWEAAMTADRLGLRNLVAVVDANGSGSVITLDRDAWQARFTAFGWHTVTVDGHDTAAIADMLRREAQGPVAVICRTVKGRGLAAAVEGSNTLSAEVAPEHLPGWDTGALIGAALTVIDRHHPAAAARRTGTDNPPPPPVPGGERPDRTALLGRMTSPPAGTAVVAKKALGGQLAAELAGLPVLWMAPDAIRNSGLLERMTEVGSWDWERTGADVLQLAIAEQDAASLAAGTSAGGLWPVLFSMEGFYWRMLDQIRESIAFPRLPVLLVGTSGGLGDLLGPMVQSDGALSALMAIPGLEVFEAADLTTAKLLAAEALTSNRPAYLRLPHEAVPVRRPLAELSGMPLDTGAWTLTGHDHPDPDLVLVTAGALREAACESAETLRTAHGQTVRVVEVFSPTRLNRLPAARLQTLLPPGVRAVSIHNAPSSVLGNLLPTGSLSIGADGWGIAGWPQEALYEAAGLTAEAVTARIVKELGL